MAIDKEKTLQAAQKAVEKKKYDLAIEEYRKLAAAEKNDPRWLLKIGDTQQKRGDFVAAIESYEQVARFYSAQGFHLKAVAVYNTVRDLLTRQPPQIQTKYEHVPIRLAELYEKLQLTSDALATWDAIADRMQRDGRDREATDVYKRVVGLDPSNPLAHLRLAEALSRQKDIEGAISEFAATAEQLTAQKRIDDALKVYERLLHHRQDPKYAKPAAELYLQRGGQNDGVAAIAKIQICLKSDPKSVELIALLGRGFVAIGQLDKALTIFKESQRLAAEQQKVELRREVVKELQKLAPNDEQVRALVAEVLQGKAPQAARPQPAPAQQQPALQPTRPQPQAQPTRPQPGKSVPTYDLEEEEIEEVEPIEEDEEVEFEEREAAEEIGEIAQSQRKGSRVAEVIANADAFRKVKLYAKALTTLRIGLELDPRSVPIRERIRDILIETGDTDQAISEMTSLAAILLAEGDLQGAYDNLAWILEADPEHAQATSLMEQLQSAAGNAPSADATGEVDGDELIEVEEEEDDLLRPEPQLHSQVGSFDELDDPLPSYAHELDEPLAPPQQQHARAPQAQRADRTDRVLPAGTPRSAGPGELPSYELEDGGRTASVPAAPAAIIAEPPSAEIEAALEEADFYAAQGVFETARETIEDALRGSPNNALLVEKLREIDALSRGRSVAPPAPPPSQHGDRAFDIAASLDALDELDKVEQPKFAHSEQVDVEEVFQKFKMGVAAQVDASDSQTHYDLGIAYEQMMLLDDAIGEFKIASRDLTREALCHSMIGMIYKKKGQLADATEAFKAGLHAEQVTREEELALLFELGSVWDERKNFKEAIYYFKRVVAMDPKYRDAKSRIVALEKKLGGPQAEAVNPGSGARAIEDDFDAAFDEIIAGKRKAH